MDLETLLTMARDAARSGKSWSSWTFEDSTGEAFDAVLSPLRGRESRAAQEAIENAFALAARETWPVRWTTAPADYDGFGAMTVEACGDYHGKPLRKVAIDPRYLDWHAARYGSGLHPTWDTDPREADRRAAEERDRRERERVEHDAKRVAGLEWLKTATDAELDELDDFNAFEARGLSYKDIRAFKAARRETAEKAALAMEWARCLAAVPEGATIIDNGYTGPADHYGRRAHRPSRVYCDVRLTRGWPDTPDNAIVVAADSASAGSLALVADRIASGDYRVAAPNEVAPAPVVARIGAERWKEIRAVDVDGKRVYVGRPLWGETLVLDEKGCMVRSKRVVARALESSGEPSV